MANDLMKQMRRWITGGKERWRALQPTEGRAQQQGCDQQDGAGGQSPHTVVATRVAVAIVGPVAVVARTTLHLKAVIGGLAAETTVRAELDHSVCEWEWDKEQLVMPADLHS